MTHCQVCHKPLSAENTTEEEQFICHCPLPHTDHKLVVPAAPVQFDPEATKPDDERPKIGRAIILAYEDMTAQELGDREASAILESKLCPLLANALTQPLQFDWVCEYFVAVQLVHIDQDKTHVESMRQVLATFLLMACGQMPWPAPPKDETAETGGASAN